MWLSVKESVSLQNRAIKTGCTLVSGSFPGDFAEPTRCTLVNLCIPGGTCTDKGHYAHNHTC